jgi:hypothetical protein
MTDFARKVDKNCIFGLILPLSDKISAKIGLSRHIKMRNVNYFPNRSRKRDKDYYLGVFEGALSISAIKFFVTQTEMSLLNEIF